MPRGQTAEMQAERLQRGCCPIHGLAMYQVGRWYEPMDGRPTYTIVGCPRQDCGVTAKASSPDGPAQLVPEGFVPPDLQEGIAGALEEWLGNDPSRFDLMIERLRRQRDALLG